MPDRSRRQRRRDLAACGPGNEERRSDYRERRRKNDGGPDRAQYPLTPQMNEIAARHDRRKPRHQKHNPRAAHDTIEIVQAGNETPAERGHKREEIDEITRQADRRAAGK